MPSRAILFILFLFLTSGAFANTSVGRWTTTAPLSRGRMSAAAAVLPAQNKLVFIGGQNSSQSTVEYYNTSNVYGGRAGALLDSSVMTIERTGFGCAELAGGIYIGAGYANLIHPDTIDRFDGSQWTTLNVRLTANRTGLAAGAADGKVLFAGGLADSSGVSALVEILDVGSVSLTFSTLSTARRQLASVTLGSRIYFAGGRNDTAAVSAIDTYDTAQAAFMAPLQLSVARFGLNGAAIAGVLAFAGGDVTEEFMSPSDAVDFYSSSTNLWTSGNLPSGARSFLAAAGVASWLIFAGGIASQQCKDWVDIYDTVNGMWLTNPGALSVPRAILQGATLSPPNAAPYVLFGGGLEQGDIPNAVVDMLILNVCQPPAPIPDALCVGIAWVVNATTTITNITVGSSPVIIIGDTIIDVIVISGNGSISVPGGSVTFTPTSTIILIQNNTISKPTQIPIITTSVNISGTPVVVVRTEEKCLKNQLLVSDTTISVLLTPGSGCGSLARSTITAITVSVLGAALLLFALAILFYIKRNEWSCIRLLFRRQTRKPMQRSFTASL